jgi:hypothetical protein
MPSSKTNPSVHRRENHRARKTIVELLDDIDGKPAEESIAFSLDGVTYEIDLSAQNASKLRTSFAPYVDKARKPSASDSKVGRRRTGADTGTTNTREQSADIRSWAAQHGITVNARGRIPGQVLEAYKAKDPSMMKTPASEVVPQTTFQTVSNP